jgi:hypothetical protein
MNDSTFDPNKFLDAVTTDAATRRPPLNPSIEYRGTVGEPKMRNVQGKKDPSKSYIFMDVPITIDLTANPAEHKRVGQDKVTLVYGVSVDVNETGLDWSPGKNTGLRLLREALNMNKPGEAFSIRNMEGRDLRVVVRHEEYPERSGEFQDRVKSVARI